MPSYNSYYPYYGQNYYQQSFQPSYQQMQQPVQQPIQQPVIVQPQSQNQPVSPSGIIWISGMQEAQMYPVAPNNAVALWENSGKTIYLKQADATGKPTMRIYDLVERTETASTASGTQDVKVPDYATKEDLGKVVGAVKSIDGTIKGIDELIGSMKSDIDAMKSDMYGIAGKKKTAKKQEADDDT